jgi:hypothetical protein
MNPELTARSGTSDDPRVAELAMRQGSGLDFRLAVTLEEVIKAWQLVYRAYLRSELILPNRQEIHTNPGAVQEGTVVVVGTLEEEICATISAYLDRSDGLPLDAIYAAELGALRARGHRLVEVGLLADRRAKLSRSFEATLRLMKFAYFWGLLNGMTDIVIGVHPHHSGFYQRVFGFDLVGEESCCPWVNNAPVVPLQLALRMVEDLGGAPRGLRFFMQEPLDGSHFKGRFAPTPAAIEGTIIEARLNEMI